MPRGPKPLPADVHRLRGNPSKRAPRETVAIEDDDLDAAGASDFAEAPAWLSPAGVAIWRRLAPGLSSQNLLKPIDELTFARYCQMFSRWLEANEALNNQDLVVVTQSAHVTMDRINKNLAVQLMLEQRLLNLEDRFGLNPAERQRIVMQRAAAPARPGELPFGNAAPPPPENPATAADAGPIGFLQ